MYITVVVVSIRDQLILVRHAKDMMEVAEVDSMEQAEVGAVLAVPVLERLVGRV